MGVDAQHVHADYKGGLRMVTLPKAAQAQPKPITVQVS
jgi:HSP20 family molecular chaperone IbpA